MTDTEKATLCARIDELCAEVERLHADQWGEGFNAGCDAANAALKESVEHYKAENAKLRKLANGYEALTATLCNERGCDGCPFDGTEQIVCEHMRLQTCLSELDSEVDE